MTLPPETAPDLSVIARRARRRLLVHLVVSLASIVPVVAYREQAKPGLETWAGWLLLATCTMHAGLGVSAFKEGIPSMRSTRGGDVRDEPRILRHATARASRDTFVAGAAVAAALLLAPSMFDARPVMALVLAAGLADFWVRQAVLRRRRARGQASMR